MKLRSKSIKIAALITLAALLIGVFHVSSGAVALSQTQHAVNATLAWLKSLIVGGQIGKPPRVPRQTSEVDEQPPNHNLREVMCAACIFMVSEDNQGLWQSLQDQGIEWVRASTDPQVSYGTLRREQTQSFDASETLKCLSAPRFTVLDGEPGFMSIKDMTTQGPRGLALGWLPVISSDGRTIELTLSFHDGRNGFEIPNVRTEPGGGVLIRAKGIFPAPEQGRGGAEEMLIRVHVDTQ